MHFSRLYYVSTCVIIALFLTSNVGCSSGSGGGSDVLFFGKVREVNPAGGTQSGALITVCALGQSDVTNDLGEWSFAVDSDDFDGGTVVFDFNGPLVAGQAAVANLNAGSETFEIVFVVQQDKTIVVQSVAQDVEAQVVVEDEAPTVTEEEQNEPLPIEPQAKACEIIRRSNITITDVKTPIIHQTGDTCPKEINTLVAIGNIHPIAFEYEVTVDTTEIIIDSTVETAEQGELNRHDASYSCLATETFLANVTARITRYFPAGEAPITRDEAIAMCGSNAHVGNTEDTVQVVVEVQA